VALLTLLSVAWAESITAINNSNGVRYFSSVDGRGFARLRRWKISARLDGVIKNEWTGLTGFTGLKATDNILFSVPAFYILLIL
jgi:hypothetical protein